MSMGVEAKFGTSKNRFEEVDGPQEDAVTLLLEKVGDRETGRIHCPAALTGGRLAADTVSEEMAAKDAFRSAIKLANEIKAPICVADPHKLWQSEWGALMRADDGDEEA